MDWFKIIGNSTTLLLFNPALWVGVYLAACYAIVRIVPMIEFIWTN